MMKKSISLLLFLSLCLASFAQSRKITGRIVDSETGEGMMQATVQLLRADSTFAAGSTADKNGAFAVKAPSNGKYIIKVSNVGYATLFKNVSVSADKDVAVGKLSVKTDAKMLKETTVTGQAAKVVVKKDTFVYNASAYRTPEGSAIEELVKRLPGASIDDDGKITINGKEVTKIKVDGKEFMTGDTQTAMKNLPTSIVERVKAYDEKSDLAKVTGIDDGNESTVLDFGLKRGMNKGLFSNADLGYGTEDRYAAKLMGAYMNGNYRVMLFGNANNVNDKGFPGGGGRGNFGRGSNGLNSAKMLGVNFNYEETDKLKIDGHVRWNHSGNDSRTESSTENFVSTVGSFSNSLNQSYSRSNSWDARMRFEWTPDTMTNIMFRPNISYSTSDSRSTNKSASFNTDPYQYVSDPLDAASLETMSASGQAVNSNSSESISYSESKKFGGSLQYNRRLSSMGRNFTLRAEGSYSEGESNNLSLNNVHLYQVQNQYGLDSTYQTNRYKVTPTRNYSYSVQATYSEPLWKATFLQFSYKFNYSFSKSAQTTYDFSNLGESFFSGLTPSYRGWNDYLSRLDSPYETYEDKDLSRYSEYKNYTHDIEVMFRMIRQKYQLNAGVLVQPQSSHFIQKYQGVDADTTRTVVNVTPTLDFRYRFNDVSSLRINYRGTTSQPSMSNLLDITDDSDPLNISMGNPGLKPSFTNNFFGFYNNYIQNHYQMIAAHASFSATRNSISSKVTYDETTGGRTTRPENINGNWNMSLGAMYNVAIDTAGVWNISTDGRLSYDNAVGYVSLNQTSDSQKSTTKTLNLNERLAASYRKDWLEVELDGSFSYNHSRNPLQSQGNLDTWQFAYGGTVYVTCPWGTSISTDLHQNSRRGYNDNSMNTNELVWNAQVSQSFLKGKSLTVMLQFYDILDNQSNFSRTINAMQRSDTEYNAINSYAMLHVVYRLNLFGTKQSRREMREGGRRPDFGGPGGPGGPGGGGGRPMRVGGGRPTM